MLKLKELIEIWRRDNSLTQALLESYAMLESTRIMFDKSVHSLRYNDAGEIAMDVYQMDKVVNSYLQDVRQKVFKHIALTGGANIVPSLVLTSIVIDVERIGDYTKNITDLAIAHPKRLRCGMFEDDIVRIEAAVKDMFGKIVPCLKASDEAAGLKLMQDNSWITKKCDEIVTAMIKEQDSSLSTSDTVAIALYARHLKRIAAHLINIASSVVNPFERVGFREA
ncbi:MAG: hypothetical protein FJ215_09850 [Ignavibacteria bacterium]|nr:hypothetical protein [Ignavibacteria bacterium]